MTQRPATLARLGFADTDRAATLARTLGLAPVVLEAAGSCADPDLALVGLARLAEAAPDREELIATVESEAPLRERLLAVLGASQALGAHLARHPEDWRRLAPPALMDVRPSAYGLTCELLAAVGAAGPDEPAERDPGVLDRLRRAHRRALLVLAARDLVGGLAVEDTAGELADVAAATLTAALAVSRAGLAEATASLAVVGMGKCGGRELNYVSDVDVVFVTATETELGLATALAARLVRACAETTAEGSIWPVDTGLRPEGRDGPLVRTLASYRAYYLRWAKTWEFQALLKARPVCGDAALGSTFVEEMAPLIWSASPRPRLVEEVQQMRRRVAESLPRATAGRELKLGRGGLRDVEFAVQLLQLVHGRSDSSLRSGTTLVALSALAAGGYVGRDDATSLAAAYRFLRTAEHRLQLYQLRRTHLLPEDPVALRRLARSMGYRADPVTGLSNDLQRHLTVVRRLHEKLFYRPLLGAVARLPAEAARLEPAAALARLEALGFADPAAALRHIQALSAGLSRRAAIQRTLLPAMLGWFADAADPDAGLLAFRQVSDALGATPWYLRLLRDEGFAAQRLARLLATSRYVADLLARAPAAVALLANDRELQPRSRAEVIAAMLAGGDRDSDWETAVAAARSVRRQELLRTACADLLAHLDLAAVGSALADITSATLEAALRTATAKVAAECRGELPVTLAAVGMGRLGGGEQGYGSDADVLFVYRPLAGPDDPDATQAAHDVAAEMRRLLMLPAPDPPLVVDADLRPEGRQGPLVRSLDAYAEYYRRWAAPWEYQALLKARPVAGDPALGEDFIELADRYRYPQGGVGEPGEREIRRVKARIEAERLPRGADPNLHLKLGRGGLADVEWTVQLLQLRHAHEVVELRTTATRQALRAAAGADLLSETDAAALEAAWSLASRVRNALLLVRGRPGESIPGESRMLAGLARAVGYPAGGSGALVEDYRRLARRARAVVERIFFG